MRTFIGILALMAVQDGSCLNANRPVSATYSPEMPGIIGGDLAEHGEFPYQVSIQHKSILGEFHVCGGSIASERYIVTTASCIERFKAKNLRVIGGMTSLKEDVDTKQEIKGEIKINHESYLPSTNENDIALIKLEADLVMNDFVQAIAIPTEPVQYGTTCVMTGWGATTESGDSVTDLHKVNLQLVERILCRTFYGAAAISDCMICAGQITGGLGFCNGDQGGPLQCNNYLYGLSSWGKGCAEPSYPGVYTDVFEYRDWIEGYISEGL